MNIFHILNKKAMTLIAGLAIIGFSSFKLAELNTPPQDGWYAVTPHTADPTDETQQTIGSRLSTDPPENSATGCALKNEGNRCAIHLAFKNTASAVPATVSAARSDIQVQTVGADSKLP